MTRQRRYDLGGRLLSVADGQIEVRQISKSTATAIIVAGHYSKSTAWASSLHFGVFHASTCIGALQFGPGMNPASGAKVVAGTTKDGWLELNRMWLSDTKPPNAASRAISMAVEMIRSLRPSVEWIQSFADSRCGKLGGVYQAANFLYLGCHETTFYYLDGEWFHQSLMGRAAVDKRGWGSGPKAARLAAGRDRAQPHRFMQYRYLLPLQRSVHRRLLLPCLPYPKPLARAVAS